MADNDRELDLRRSHKLQLIQNPNFFGNLTDLNIAGLPKPVLKKIGDTTFEELTCIGLNPATDILTAVVRIKKGTGYLGDSCTDGSREYVRFYLDYGDGTWVDHGSASFEAHDLGFNDNLCYAVSIHLDPKRRSCCDRDPVLPRVRAILSWNIEPPAGMPNYPPVWGNILERNVQIAPRNALFCWILDHVDIAGIQQIDPTLIDKVKAKLTEIGPIAPPIPPVASLMEKIEKGDDLAVLRAVYPTVAKLAADQTDLAAFKSLDLLKPLKIDLSALGEFLLTPKFNTTYEELHCVGLDRDLERLHGIIQIKRKSGYSGDLCHAGSREYVAFYLDFGTGWEYQGTTSVEVHDIDKIPAGGLWYQAALPVNLDKHKLEWCKAGKARIRGVLSWAVPPLANQPDFVPHWGDREDCNIEVRPLPVGVPPGMFLPVLQTIGRMALNKIAGGYANGDPVGAHYSGGPAEDSPFGGEIDLTAFAFFPPGPLEYRVMLKGPSDAVAKPYTKTFTASVTTFPNPNPVDVPQVASGDWFTYLPTLFVSVASNLIGVLKGLEDGMHFVHLEFRQPAGPVIAQTMPKAFMVDNTAPKVDVEITSGVGNCGKFGITEVISGTFSMTEIHSGGLSISVTPTPEAGGGTLAILSASPLGSSVVFPVTETSAATTSVSLSYPLSLNGAGVVAGTWELDTTGMAACGYNISIHGRDRTIVNSGSIGWPASDIEGFCLE